MSNAEFMSAQEMKFNNDFVYQTNQSLQDLSRSLECLSLLHGESHAKLESRQKSIEIYFENLSQNVMERLNAFSQKLGDFETRNLLVKEQLDQKLDTFSKNYLTVQTHLNSTVQAIRNFEDLSRKVDRVQSS